MDTCKNCQTQFKRKYPKGKHRKIYCSCKCRYEYESHIEMTCKTCQKTFKRHRLHVIKSGGFCSRSCHQRDPCQLCGKIILGRQTFQSGDRKYCSRSCSAFVNRTMKSKVFYVVKGFARSIKDHGKILCNRCKIDDINVLIVHHIDENRSNNEMNNLEVLCANCHHKHHWTISKDRDRRVKLANMISKYHPG